MYSDSKRSRKRKHITPQRNSKDKRKCKYDAVKDFTEGFESPDVTILDSTHKDTYIQAKSSGTVYDGHKRPKEFDRRKCNMPSFKVHQKSVCRNEQFEIDLTAESDEDPDILSKDVSVATSHVIGEQDSKNELCYSNDSQKSQQTRVPTAFETIDIIQKARSRLKVKVPFKEVSSHPLYFPHPPSHHNPERISCHPKRFVNSMESSLPACTYGSKPTTHTTISTDPLSDSTANAFHSKDLSKQNEKDSNSSIISSNIHPNQSQTGESPASSVVKHIDLFRREPAPSSVHQSINSPTSKCEISSEDSPSTQLQFIPNNIAGSPVIENNSKHLKKDSMSQNHSETISVDSQSSISPMRDKEFIIDESQQNPVCIQSISNMKSLKNQPKCHVNPPNEQLNEYFLPPTRSVCSTVLCESQNYESPPDSNLREKKISTSLCHDIIDSMDNNHEWSSVSISSASTSLEENIAHTQTLLPSVSKSEVVSSSNSSPISHSNPFTIQKQSNDIPVHGSVFGSPLVHKHELKVPYSSPIKKKLSLKLVKLNTVPCLSKKEFTIEISSEASGKKPSQYQSEKHKHPGKSYPLRDGICSSHNQCKVQPSDLERQPLRGENQLTTNSKGIDSNSRRFYNMSGQQYSLLPHLPGGSDDRSKLKSKQFGNVGSALASFTASNLKLIHSRGFVPGLEEEDNCVQLEVAQVHIGRMKASRVFNVDLRETQLTVVLDYDGLNHTVRIDLDRLQAWQMHLECDPRVIVIQLKHSEIKKLASNLSNKFHLDSDFLNSKSNNPSECYIILELDESLPSEHMDTLNKILKLASQRSLGAFVVDSSLSTLEAKEILSGAQSVKPTRTVKNHAGKSAFNMFVEGVYASSSNTSTDLSPPVRRSQRVRKPVTHLMDPISIEEPILKTKPSKELLTFTVPAGSKVGIEISTSDVETLNPGEYLNDIIVDFYLRYIWYEQLAQEYRTKIHIFSSFFHTRLKDASRDNKELSTPQRLHDRVKTWTRRVDLFNKEYIILPICERAHWFVVFIYKPGEFDPSSVLPRQRSKTKLKSKKAANISKRQADSTELVEESGIDKECVLETPPSSTENVDLYSEDDTAAAEQEISKNTTTDDERVEGDNEEVNIDSLTHEDVNIDSLTLVDSPSEEPVSLRHEIMSDDSSDLPCFFHDNSKVDEDTSPCILVLDSLGIQRTAIVKTIRNYLTVEWKEKKGKNDEGELSFDFLPAKYPKIPLQNNSSDCGVFVLQYVESLLMRMKQGKPYPQQMEEWGSYEKTKVKRKEIMELIMDLSKSCTSCTTHAGVTPTEF